MKSEEIFCLHFILFRSRDLTNKKSNVYTFDSKINFNRQKTISWKKIWMLLDFSNTLSFVNLDYKWYQFAKLLHWIKYFTQVLGSICCYTNLIILHGFRPICTNLTSYCTKLSILQLVGLTYTHLTSYCTKLSILQLVGLIHTHLTSCCMVGVIYSFFNDITLNKWRKRRSHSHGDDVRSTQIPMLTTLYWEPMTLHLIATNAI
jgi:hypothetical protein